VEEGVILDMRLVLAFFMAAAFCVVLRVILLSYIVAAAASRTGIARWPSDTAGMCRELDVLVPIACAAAFALWCRVIWISGGSLSCRVARCAGAFLVSAAFFLAIGFRMEGVAIFR